MTYSEPWEIRGRGPALLEAARSALFEVLTIAVRQLTIQSGPMCDGTAPEEAIAIRISAGAPQFGTLFVLEGEDAPRRV